MFTTFSRCPTWIDNKWIRVNSLSKGGHCTNSVNTSAISVGLSKIKFKIDLFLKIENTWLRANNMASLMTVIEHSIITIKK